MTPNPRAARLSRAKRKRNPDRSANGLWLKALHLREGWFYERETGIDVVAPEGSRVVFIPFRKLASSLRRIAKVRGIRL